MDVLVSDPNHWQWDGVARACSGSWTVRLGLTLQSARREWSESLRSGELNLEPAHSHRLAETSSSDEVRKPACTGRRDSSQGPPPPGMAQQASPREAIMLSSTRSVLASPERQREQMEQRRIQVLEYLYGHALAPGELQQIFATFLKSSDAQNPDKSHEGEQPETSISNDMPRSPSTANAQDADGDVCLPAATAQELLVSLNALTEEGSAKELDRLRRPPHAPLWCSVAVDFAQLELRALSDIIDAEETSSLTVHLLAARDLKALDMNGTSDPYCVLSLGKHKPARSNVHYKTCNPVFKEKFEFSNPTLSDTLEVEVFDKDLAFDDLIGAVRIPLDEVNNQTQNYQPPQWYPVIDGDDCLVGELLLHLRLPTGKKEDLQCDGQKPSQFAWAEVYLKKEAVPGAVFIGRSSVVSPVSFTASFRQAGGKDDKKKCTNFRFAPLRGLGTAARQRGETQSIPVAESIAVTHVPADHLDQVCIKVFSCFASDAEAAEARFGSQRAVGEVQIDLSCLAMGGDYDEWFGLGPFDLKAEFDNFLRQDPKFNSVVLRPRTLWGTVYDKFQNVCSCFVGSQHAGAHGAAGASQQNKKAAFYADGTKAFSGSAEATGWLGLRSHLFATDETGQSEPAVENVGRLRLKISQNPTLSELSELVTADKPLDVHFCEVVSIIATKRASDEGPGHVLERDFFPLDPDSAHKQAWDILVVLLLMYATFAVPLFLAFGEEPEPGAPMSTYDISEITLDSIFCFDILLTFMTAYVKNGVYHNKLSSIAFQYLRRWFWVDMPGSFPFDKVIIYLNGGVAELGPLLRAIKFARILKVMRAAKLLFKLDALETKESSKALTQGIQIFRSFFITVFFAHLCGCLFYLSLNNSEVRDGGPYTVQNFLSTYYDGDDGDMLHEHEPVGASNLYVICLYWGLSTVTTIGYGDVYPTTPSELLFGVWYMGLGALAFSFASSSIVNTMNACQGIQANTDDEITRVRELLNFRLAPTSVKRMAFNYVGACWRVSGTAYGERTIWRNLPTNVSTNLMKQLSAKGIMPLLQGLNTRTIATVMSYLRLVEFQDDIPIYRRLEASGSMYFLTQGEVELRDSGRNRRKCQVWVPTSAASVPESMFGEESLFHSIWPCREETAVCLTPQVSCLELTDKMVDAIAKEESHFRDAILEYCTLRAASRGMRPCGRVKVVAELANVTRRRHGRLALDTMLHQTKSLLISSLGRTLETIASGEDLSVFRLPPTMSYALRDSEITIPHTAPEHAARAADEAESHLRAAVAMRFEGSVVEFEPPRHVVDGEGSQGMRNESKSLRMILRYTAISFFQTNASMPQCNHTWITPDTILWSGCSPCAHKCAENGGSIYRRISYTYVHTHICIYTYMYI